MPVWQQENRRLDHATVRGIRTAVGTRREIARHFGVSKSMVDQVRDRRSYADVPDVPPETIDTRNGCSACGQETDAPDLCPACAARVTRCPGVGEAELTARSQRGWR